MSVPAEKDSRKAMARKALCLCDGLSPTDRKVAAVLIEHFNVETGRCDPSATRIAALIGVDARAVRRSLARITAPCDDEEALAGGLVFFGRVTYGGRSNCNSYQPIWHRFEAVCAAFDERMKATTETLTELSGDPCQNCPETPDRIVTQNHFRKPGIETREQGERRQVELLLPINGTKSATGPPVKTKGIDHGEAAIDAMIGKIERAIGRQGPTIQAAYWEHVTPEQLSHAASMEVDRSGSGIAHILDMLDGLTTTKGGERRLCR